MRVPDSAGIRDAQTRLARFALKLGRQAAFGGRDYNP